MNLHLRMEFQITKQLRRDEEVLARALATRNVHHTLVYHAFVAGVHTLIDFVDDAEGGASEVLQGHEVEDCGDGALAAGLALRV